MKDKNKFNLMKSSLEIFLDKELNIWVSVKKNSIATILKDNGLNKRMGTCIIKILLSSGVLEKRGTTSAVEYKILRKPTNLEKIIQDVLNDYSSVRNSEYIFGREKLELNKKYYMVFNQKIFEIQIVGVKIKKENQLFYEVKKTIKSVKKTTILKNIKYKDVFLTITSAGDEVKRNAIKECKFI